MTYISQSSDFVAFPFRPTVGPTWHFHTSFHDLMNADIYI